MKKAILSVCLVILSSACIKKATTDQTVTFSESDFPVRELSFGSQQFKFRIYSPKDTKPGERLPVMLYLHGSDERGEDNQGQLSGPAPLILPNPNNFHFIIVFPQCPAGQFWNKDMIGVAVAELDQTVKEFNGDESRLYLAGFSLGGYGVWTTGAMYPDKFAAIVPMSGRVLPRPAERKNVDPEILKLADEPDPYAAFANKIGKTSVWIFHGANDPIVPIDNSRQMAKAFKDAENENARYTELENTGHVSLNAAFGNPELFEWLAKQTLSREILNVPDDLVYVDLLSELVYNQDRVFGADLGKIVIIKEDTVVPEDTERLSSFPDLEVALVSDLVERNKTPGKISLRYDTYVPYKETQSKKSLE